mgnify:FL=1
MDEESLAVMYRYDRGEPRGPHKKDETWDGRGDCVQCRQCMVVCPMGIDIREGLQLECIQCSLCIDACNNIMNKIGRPEGLIAYDSLKNFERRKDGGKNIFRIIRPRTVIYSAILLIVSTVMLYALMNRSEIDVNILRDRNPLFVQLSNGDIRNGYTIKIMNKSEEEKKYSIGINGINNSEISAEGINDYNESGAPIIIVGRDKLRSIKLFIAAPKNDLQGDSTEITFTTSELEGTAQDIQMTTFKGPK